MQNMPAMVRNKFTTYLLYAIGEIVLVVIGIFIAIQLNNLNELRKLKLKEVAYYCKLSEDIRQDALQIDRLIAETKNRVHHANTLIGLLQAKDLNPARIAGEMFDAVALVTFTFRPSTSAFEDIKSSGNLGILDEAIKKAIIEYYVYCDGIVDVVDINSDQYVRLFQESSSYAKEGWQLIDFANEALDSTLVDLDKLDAMVNADQKYQEDLMSDALYYVASGTRVKMLYETLKVEILKMKDVLEQKCENDQN